MKFSWSRLIYAIAIFVLVGFGIYTLRGSQGIPALMKKQAEIEALEKGNADLARDIEKKRVRLKRLEHNPAEQEREIRRQLKLVHPGETVYNSPDQDKK